MKEKDIETLQHTTWRCQYHIVFAPKYRRMAIYGQIKQDIGQILRRLCEQKGVEIIEAQACPDHIHMLLSIPPKYSVSQIMGYLKGKSNILGWNRGLSARFCRHCYTLSEIDALQNNSEPKPKTTGSTSRKRNVSFCFVRSRAED